MKVEQVNDDEILVRMTLEELGTVRYAMLEALNKATSTAVFLKTFRSSEHSEALRTAKDIEKVCKDLEDATQEWVRSPTADHYSAGVPDRNHADQPPPP